MNDRRETRHSDGGARRNYIMFCLVATLTMTGLVAAAVVYLQ